jgi:CHASE2 domain-containing sensor protein
MRKEKIDFMMTVLPGGKSTLGVLFVGLTMVLMCCQESAKDQRGSVISTDSITILDVGSMSRAEIANAIEMIAACRPKVIGINLVFEGRSDNQSDSILAGAIRDAGNVVLVMDTKNNKLNSSDSLFVKESAAQGLRYLGGEDNKVSTCQIFTTIDNNLLWSFPVTVAGQFNPEVAINTMNSVKGNVYYKIFFDADNDDFEYVKLDKVDCSKVVDRIILIGSMGGKEDLFETSTGAKLYGTVIMANAIGNILNGRFEEVSE